MSPARSHGPFVIASFGIPLLLIASASAFLPATPDPASPARVHCPHCGGAVVAAPSHPYESLVPAGSGAPGRASGPVVGNAVRASETSSGQLD